jgi:hypothetical protein
MDLTAFSFSPTISSFSWVPKFWNKNKNISFPLKNFVDSLHLKSFHHYSDQNIDIDTLFKNIKNYYEDSGQAMKIYISLELNDVIVLQGPRNIGKQDTVNAKLYILKEWITESQSITNNESTGLPESSRNYFAIRNSRLEIIDSKEFSAKNSKNNIYTMEENSFLASPISKNGTPCGTLAMSWVAEGHAMIEENQFLCFLLSCYCSSLLNSQNGADKLMNLCAQKPAFNKRNFKLYSL